MDTREIEIECMICRKSIKTEITADPTRLSLVFDKVARDYKWQFSILQHKLFLCCKECIPIAYNPIPGTLGQLKRSKKSLAIEDAEI